MVSNHLITTNHHIPHSHEFNFNLYTKQNGQIVVHNKNHIAMPWYVRGA